MLDYHELSTNFGSEENASFSNQIVDFDQEEELEKEKNKILNFNKLTKKTNKTN